MVKVRHVKPTIITGRQEIHENDEVLSSEQRAALFPASQTGDLRWAEFIVSQARAAGMTVEEIQQGFRNDQTTAS